MYKDKYLVLFFATIFLLIAFFLVLWYNLFTKRWVMKRNILELKRRLYDESDYEFYRYVSSLKGEQLLLFDKLMEELLDTRLDAAAGLSDKNTWILRKRVGIFDVVPPTYEKIGLDISDCEFKRMIKQNDGRYHMVKSCGSRKCVLSAEQVQGVIKASCGNILLEHERRSNKIKQKNYLSVDDNIGRMGISRRYIRVLKMREIVTIDQLLNYPLKDVGQIEGVGPIGFQEIVNKLFLFGFIDDSTIKNNSKKTKKEVKSK